MKVKENPRDLLSSYVDALRSIIYINNFDFAMVDELIESVSHGAKVLEFNNALGQINFKTKSPEKEYSLEEFLLASLDDGYDHNTFIVLKDIEKELDNPKVLALLKRIAEMNSSPKSYSCTVFIVSTVLKVPVELESHITLFDIPLPNDKEVSKIIKSFAKEVDIEIKEDVINEITLSFKGLSEFQIKQILRLAYQEGGFIDENDKKLILSEKEQFIKKSGMLDLVNFKEKIEDIGGLEILKKWLTQKAKLFQNLDKAIKFGVDIPKGIMIVGMPGCGKSLTAKASARLFDIPLVRLDIGRLLGKYVGISEENMRKALTLAEAISPCVLWIDEVEKAFSGIGGTGGASDITTRLFGQFLTWLQEKETSVFVVATANDISGLPPEFLRKGRFDEIFFVDLPDEKEIEKIIDIHLIKRKKWNKEIDKAKIAAHAKGYSGADIEAIVNEAVERAFLHDKTQITTENLLDVIKETKSISETLKDKIDNIRKTVEKIDIKSASKESSHEKSDKA